MYRVARWDRAPHVFEISRGAVRIGDPLFWRSGMDMVSLNLIRNVKGLNTFHTCRAARCVQIHTTHNKHTCFHQQVSLGGRFGQGHGLAYYSNCGTSRCKYYFECNGLRLWGVILLTNVSHNLDSPPLSSIWASKGLTIEPPQWSFTRSVLRAP